MSSAGDSREQRQAQAEKILGARAENPMREFGELLREAERERRRAELRHQVALGHLEHAEQRAELLDQELTRTRASLEEITGSRAWHAVTRFRRLKRRLLGRP